MPRAVFFGTPEWAIPSLDALAASRWDLAAVVTNPDRPAGRGHALSSPPVKQRALELGVEVRQPPSARAADLLDWLGRVEPDVAVVVAYGKILPAEILAVPRLGFVNVHFSLLPEYRGAAPVQRALLDGRDETGISIMVLTEGMDEGPVLARSAVAIDPEESAGTLGARLAGIGAALLMASLDAYAAGELEPEPQDLAGATYAPKLTPEEARIDWSRPARAIHDQVRALDPDPGAYSEFRGLRLKVYSTSIAEGTDLSPGATRHEGGKWLVGTGDGALAITEAQLAGKRRMSGDELARGLRLEPSERFR